MQLLLHYIYYASEYDIHGTNKFIVSKLEMKFRFLGMCITKLNYRVFDEECKEGCGAQRLLERWELHTEEGYIDS